MQTRTARVARACIDSHVAVSLVAFALTIGACSSAPPLPIDDDDSGDDGSSTKTGKGEKSSSPSDDDGKTSGKSDAGSDPADPNDPNDPNDPAPTGGDCSAEVDADACYDCCDAIDPNGIGAAYQAFDDCICNSPGTCAQECGNSYCAGQAPSAACEDCLNADQECSAAADDVCNANAGCQQVLSCYDDSGCATK